MRILISAGESSGDLYAARLVEAIRSRHPEAEFFGCAGPRMQTAGVRAIVDARSLNVVGLVEVLAHLPRIWREFRKLTLAIRAERPDVAVLVDSPDFHLRLAKRLARAKVPVVYLIAPQAWAWRPWRARAMRRDIERLLCIFPFEREFFESRGVPTTYIGHPLAAMVKPSDGEIGFVPSKPILALLPGSRPGEASRHLPILLEATAMILKNHALTPVLALPPGFPMEPTFKERIRASSIQLVIGHTWDVLARSELALAASGTVTIEAALLGIPMVTFYRVNALSWIVGRRLVRAPFLTMVNLVAGSPVVPELMQHDMTAERIAAQALRLLDDSDARAVMRAELAKAAGRLKTARDPIEIAAEWIERLWSEKQ
jgi:lipid-A-disaccharide synthase